MERFAITHDVILRMAKSPPRDRTKASSPDAVEKTANAGRAMGFPSHDIKARQLNVRSLAPALPPLRMTSLYPSSADCYTAYICDVGNR